ncbi:hypothetical protein TNCT_255881 [Trichonephila clavata]|uniref:Uncharacterized protein n=1 Tax=Trichonephila clavata TaxID=2740835 RepID=A0A8X6J6G3_TRICU|nr:hypothetical protein TNCT_255881 [Trichonephila clavata]
MTASFSPLPSAFWDASSRTSWTMRRIASFPTYPITSPVHNRPEPISALSAATDMPPTTRITTALIPPTMLLSATMSLS